VIVGGAWGFLSVVAKRNTCVAMEMAKMAD